MSRIGSETRELSANEYGNFGPKLLKLMIIFLMVNVFNQCENSEAVVSKSC